MSHTPARPMQSWPAWALLVGLVITAGCFNGNGHGMHDRRRNRGASASAAVPTAADLAEIRGRIQAAEAAISELSPQDRTSMRQAITRAKSALERYERLASQGATRQRRAGQIYVAGAVVVADDVSGLGAADDVLLPFLALGLIATHLVTEAPAPPADLAQAWGDVIASLDAIGKTAEAIRTAGQRVSPIPPMDHCIAHLGMCLETPLGRPHSGGRWGHSICVDCNEICRRSPTGWPASTGDGKDCRWWLHRRCPSWTRSLEPR